MGKIVLDRRRWFTKKTTIILVVTGILLWLVTQFFGAPQIHRVAVATMPVTTSFTELSRNTPHSVTGPVYWCTEVAYAPFLVRANYGWVAGSLTGGGADVLYLWIFGMTFRLHEFGNWAA